ncbi:uncharacterized protein LOC143579840 [Bidens hawaiensis]|uniref:uncharacterized protein LOC143579840 n=1 Tax=Bidens hawaiensis TaxID=980011 RepID=UPI00404B8A88
MEPRVILTDADHALMNACDAVFPNATKNLCRWHISENIRRKFKGLYSKDTGTDFTYWWKVLYRSPTIQEYDNRRINMERHLIQDDRTCESFKPDDKVWQYIRKNWLYPYRHKFVAWWIDERRNYGETTTNRVESQHTNLKRYLNGSNNSLDTIARHILKMVNSQMKEIVKSFHESRSKVMEGHRQHVWLKKLINRVLTHALGLLVNEYELIHKMRDGGASCDHHLYSSSGLSCACRIEGYIVNDTCIPIKDVDPFWRRLNFDLAYPPNEEPDYEAGAPLGFPLMVSPAQVPAIEMFRSVIPGWAQPFVADIKNVRPDSNCGFRSIAVGLGIHEKHWSDIRRAMQNELETNEGWWRAMFSKEDERLYDWVHSSISYSNTVKPAPPSHWFSVPSHGHMAA